LNDEEVMGKSRLRSSFSLQSIPSSTLPSLRSPFLTFIIVHLLQDLSDWN